LFLLGKVEIDNYLAMRYHSSLNLSESEKWVQLFRAGDWTNSYKNFKVKPRELDEFVANFHANALQTEKGEVQFNFSHNSHERAAGWITDLRRNGKHLEGKVRWTRAGRQALEDEDFKYVSAELAFVYKNEETGEETNNVLTGAALTNIPFVRGMKAVALSETSESDSKEFLYLHNPRNMDAFKVMLSALREKDAVSLDEAATLNEMFATLSEEEQAEVKEEVAEVEAKTESEATEEVVEEEVVEEETNEATLAENVELSEMKAELAEKAEALKLAQSENDKMKLDMRKKEIGAKVEELSTKGILLPKQVELANELAIELSEAKAEKLFALLNNSEAKVELNKEEGHSQEGGAVNYADLHEQAVALAKENGTSQRAEYDKLCANL